MRPVREITAEEENFRLEQLPGTIFQAIRRDSVEPEPVGTIILLPFRIVGYEPDCDGSLMVKMDKIDKDARITGGGIDRIGLSPKSALVVTEKELAELFEGSKERE